MGLSLVSMMILSSTCISLVGSSGSLPASLLLLGAGTKWASHNGARAAYVDWYDNLVAHPNPSIPDPNPFLLIRNMVMSALVQYGFTVDPAADIPLDLSPYDVVVLEAYFACEPNNEPAIRDYLSNGGSVVLLEASMCYLAYYSKTTNVGTDLAPIADWFGATQLVNTGGDAHLTIDNPFGIASKAGDILIVGVSSWYAGVRGVDASSCIIATWSSGDTFAFTKEYRLGRVYYQARAFEPNSPSSQTAEVSIMPATISVGIGRNFAVDIAVNNITDLYSWELKLFYLSTVLNCTGAVEGNFLTLGGDTLFVVSDEPGYNATHGMIRLGSSLIGAVPGVSGDGTLASISFQAFALGNTGMEMLDTVMLNSQLQDITHNTVSGFVQVRQAMHDIAVSNVVSNKNMVGQNYNINITVTVENKGDFNETFNVAVSCNSSIADMQMVTDLAPDSTINLTFVWNTTGVSKGYYTISGTADNVTGETDLADNTMASTSMVYVGIPGDVNGDHEVNMRDIAPICRFFGSVLGGPRYAATYDITNNGIIDMKDISIAARNYGTTDP